MVPLEILGSPFRNGRQGRKWEERKDGKLWSVCKIKEKTLLKNTRSLKMEEIGKHERQ